MKRTYEPTLNVDGISMFSSFYGQCFANYRHNLLLYLECTSVLVPLGLLPDNLVARHSHPRIGRLHPSLPNSSGSQFLLQPISWHLQSFQTMVTLGLAFPSNLQLLIQSEEIFFTNYSVYKKYRKFLPIRAIKIVFMLKYGMHDHFY